MDGAAREPPTVLSLLSSQIFFCFCFQRLEVKLFFDVGGLFLCTLLLQHLLPRQKSTNSLKVYETPDNRAQASRDRQRLAETGRDWERLADWLAHDCTDQHCMARRAQGTVGLARVIQSFTNLLPRFIPQNHAWPLSGTGLVES